MRRHITLGQVFGRLRVIEELVVRRNRFRVYLCQCECGKRTEVTSQLLLSSKTRSCGCLRDEVAGISSTTHGRSKTPTYSIWAGMISRCRGTAPSAKASYFDKGISVCERWQRFENFFADMGERPSGMTLDRRDSDGDYCPENCRWATPKQQRENNSQALYMLTHQGKTLSLRDWSRETGIKYATIHQRFHKGWSAEKILSATDFRL